MYLPTENNKQNKLGKKLTVVGLGWHLEVTDEKSRVRIHKSSVQIIPKCHGSGTLISITVSDWRNVPM
jgi:hypothetical protein